MEKVRNHKGQMEWVLSEAELNWLREKTHEMTDKELAAKFGCSYKRLRHFKHKYRIVKQQQQKWTEAQVKFLKANYQTMGDTEIAKILQRSLKGIRKKRIYLNLHRTSEEILKIRTVNGIRTGKMRKKTPSHYHPKGEKWWQECSKTWKIRINGQEHQWHRWRYEQLHGEIPEGYMVVFKDGDKMNTSDDNLVLLKRKRGVNKDKLYVNTILWNQRKRGMEYYIARNFELLETPYGHIFVNSKHKKYQKMMQRVAQMKKPEIDIAFI